VSPVSTLLAINNYQREIKPYQKFSELTSYLILQLEKRLNVSAKGEGTHKTNHSFFFHRKTSLYTELNGNCKTKRKMSSAFFQFLCFLRLS
jgi:hypothetical protein